MAPPVNRRRQSHMPLLNETKRSRRTVLGRVALAASTVAVLVAGVLFGATSASADGGSRQDGRTISSTGLHAGQIKHVWLIILENKSYDATFTGLNQNSYLWKTLPSQGVELTNYYGTGHFSMDNYISMVSGQGPEQDTQSDCSVADTNIGTNASIITTGTDAGQVKSLAGANGANGSNGCTYPSQTPTLFNQLDAAGKTWKGYAQELGTQAGREDAVCGGPGGTTNNPDTNPTALGVVSASDQAKGITSYTGAQANDQYVAKHFPFPWFHSLTGSTKADGTRTPALTKPAQGGTDCDAAHIANLDNASGGLFHDLQNRSTTPAFSWITPNNCSDAHDAICAGNNLSGAFDYAGNPVYTPAGLPAYQPEATTPTNYTGGLYASDLFLKYYVPLIEQSAAFKDGGLIDITFDEANPPFANSSFNNNNADAYGPLKGVDQPNAANSIKSDAAGENINGKNVKTEPTGPNTPLKTDAAGDQLYPGPGDNAFIDRPPVCTSTSPNVPANCVPGIVEGGSGVTPAARTDAALGSTASTDILDPKIVATDTGRGVTGAGIPEGELSRIAVPSLVLGGGNSPDWFRQSVAAQAAAIPGAELRMVDGHDHNVPHEVISPILARFFGSLG